MAQGLARITGAVLNTVRRQGVAKGSGASYDFTEATVLVAERGVTTVTYSTENSEGIVLTRGDVVDLLCEVDVYGQRVQFRTLSAWPTDLH